MFSSDAKLILITTEGGSITLRTKEEGGGNFGHHGSKAAANMVGKLLAHDLADDGITVVMIHVSDLCTFSHLESDMHLFHSLGSCAQI